MTSNDVQVTLGLMTWGKHGNGMKVSDPKECQAMLDTFVKHGHRRVDTSYNYCSGTSEELLGDLDWKSNGILVDTKLYPSKAWASTMTSGGGAGETGISHSPQDVRKYVDKQLAAVKTDKLASWFLHGPDRSTPFEDTLRAVNDIYKEGKFERFGVSNYMAWEVAEICCICEKNGWVKPSVYQGLYNMLQRNVEAELFPCLHKFGMSFVAFNPLLGGLLFQKKDVPVESGSRFDDENLQGKVLRARYWNDLYFDAIESIRQAANKHELSIVEVALRWIKHHSLLDGQRGDAVLVGASSVHHLEQNLNDLEKGPLPDEVVDAVEQAWQQVKGKATNYYH